MDLTKEIRSLKNKLRKLEKRRHNQQVINTANSYVAKLKKHATKAELKFAEIAKKKNINLEFQHRIDILRNDGRINQFFIADFCDIKNKIIFEIDGEYHFSEEQKKKDAIRTKLLNKAGYKVFRISNKDVMDGKSTSLLYSVYRYLQQLS